MPVTPFHFGPAILAKGVAPEYLSIVAFGAGQCAIDLETLIHALTDGWPLHRDLHTFLHALPLCTIASLLTFLLLRAADRVWPGNALSRVPGETGLLPCLLAGVLGGITHPLLDGIMHSDIRPFLPASSANPLYGLLDTLTLHTVCVSAAVLGVLLIAARDTSPPTSSSAPRQH